MSIDVPPAPPPRRLALREGLVLAGALAVGLWLGGRNLGDQEDAAARAATLDAGAGAGIAALTVRTTDGRQVVPSRLGHPAVVMVVSTTCDVCKSALRDFGRLADGRPLANLWLLTLEGAPLGLAMTDSARIVGAVHAGPPSPAQEAMFTFQIRGTPTFLALDARGRVRAVLPGYPGPERMTGWLAMMRGERETP